eukprot:1190240-Prorocentrum_minimum.AAC.2
MDPLREPPGGLQGVPPKGSVFDARGRGGLRAGGAAGGGGPGAVRLRGARGPPHQHPPLRAAAALRQLANLHGARPLRPGGHQFVGGSLSGDPQPHPPAGGAPSIPPPPTPFLPFPLRPHINLWGDRLVETLNRTLLQARALRHLRLPRAGNHVTTRYISVTASAIRSRGRTARLRCFYQLNRILYRSLFAPQGHPANAAFVDSCHHHCGQWGNLTTSEGLKQPAAFHRWYSQIKQGTSPDRQEFLHIVPYPCAGCCQSGPVDYLEMVPPPDPPLTINNKIK